MFKHLRGSLLFLVLVSVTSIASAQIGTIPPASGGGGTPADPDTSVQFNDAGSLGGSAGLIYDKTTHKLTISGDFQTAPNNQIPGLSITDTNGGSPNVWSFLNFNGHGQINFASTSTLGFYGTVGRVRFMNQQGDGFVSDNTVKHCWSDGVADNSTLVLGLYENSTTALEVNNCTPGVYRDLVLRHVVAANPAATPITVAGTTANACGTGTPSIVGADEAFRVTVGGVSGTSCTVTFGTAYVNVPVCFAYDETTTTVKPSVVPSTTSVVIAGAFVAGDKVAGGCRSF